MGSHTAHGRAHAVIELHGQAIDHAKLGQEIFAALGIYVGGVPSPTNTYHGHTSQIQKRAGVPFGTVDGVESDTCPWCSVDVPRQQEHSCSEIVLYEESYDQDHPGVKAAHHGLDAAGLARARQIARGHRP